MEKTQSTHAKAIVVAVVLIAVAGVLFVLLRAPVASRAPVVSSENTVSESHGAATDTTAVLVLADKNHDGKVSENEALLLTLDTAEALDKPFDSVKQFDVNVDGKVDAADTAIIFATLDILVP